MAYGQGNTSAPRSSGFGGTKPVAKVGSVAPKKEFEEDPSKLGILYQKESEKAGTYFSGTTTQDIPKGTKIMVYVNNVKNRTEKTPTHVLKLAKSRE